jgi:hypothetical protein
MLTGYSTMAQVQGLLADYVPTTTYSGAMDAICVSTNAMKATIAACIQKGNGVTSFWADVEANLPNPPVAGTIYFTLAPPPQ